MTKENNILKDIILLISVRIEEINLEFEKPRKESENHKKIVDHSSYINGYESGLLTSRYCEKYFLEKILSRLRQSTCDI